MSAMYVGYILLEAQFAHFPVMILNVIFLISYRILKVLFTFCWKQLTIKIRYTSNKKSVLGHITHMLALQFPQHLAAACKENVNKHSTNIFQPLAVISDFVSNRPITSYASKNISLNHNHCIFFI